ncbi:PRC-barrel domain-containing protein [Peribacillus glennii]|uniref:PRC-barrel domain-containing protein n=1 Tax=Peribacillus glennii TaxID=2303991 RepID=UPI001F2795FE|nr:PRC-barrel domain-containing protein [Peribacillus glennii]
MLKGLRVYTSRGQCIGSVNDICLSESGKIEGIIVHRKAFFKKNLFFSLNDVRSFGPDGIIVEKEEASPDNHPLEGHYLFNADSLFGKMLMSEAGEELGLLHDVFFLEKMGTIVAYETTDGFFSEITEGKRLVESKHPPVLGKDAILISVYDQ